MSRMRECGLTALLPSLDDTVWLGMSAGSMVMTPRIDKEFVGWKPPTGDETAIRVVDGTVDVISEGQWRWFDA